MARLRSPAFALLLIAPFLGEVLSTATPPLDLLLPWNLALMAALYGGGALLCREFARRFGLGLPGLCLLAAAYAVYEEALVDRYWFDPRYWHDAGVGAYGVVWHTNVLLAVHLTAFHVAVSICSSIVLVECLFPARRDTAWAGRRGLTVAALAMAGAGVVTYGQFAHVPAGRLVAAALLCGVLGAGGLLSRRTGNGRERSTQRRRLAGVVAFVAAGTHFVLVYALPSTGIPWPLGVLITLAPIVAGVLVVRRMRPDGLTVVTGVLGFFILLDAAVGLGGRYDLTGGAVALAAFLWWLHRRRAAAAGADREAGTPPPSATVPQ